MSLLPQGIVAQLGTASTSVILQGSNGFNVDLVGSTYTLSYTGSPRAGTVLQLFQYKVVNSYQPTQPFSTTYNAASVFATIPITPISDNSLIVVSCDFYILSSGRAMGFGSWKNGAGLPVACGQVTTFGNFPSYSSVNTVGKFSNSVAGVAVNVDVCGFYSPATSTYAGTYIIGSSDGFAYNGSLYSEIYISEVQA